MSTIYNNDSNVRNSTKVYTCTYLFEYVKSYLKLCKPCTCKKCTKLVYPLTLTRRRIILKCNFCDIQKYESIMQVYT